MPFTPTSALLRSILLLGAFISSGCLSADSTEIFTSDSRQQTANNILFILDSSGSMNAPLPDGQSRMSALQESFAQSLQNAPANLNAGIMRFGGDSKTDRANGVAFPVSPLTQSASHILGETAQSDTLPDPHADSLVRDYLGDTVSHWAEYGDSPIVDALYEGALYFRGEPVYSGFLPAAETRAAHPVSYDGDISCKKRQHYTWCNYSKGLCSETGLRNCQDYRGQVWCEHKACHIASGQAVYRTPVNQSCQQNTMILVADGEPSANHAAARIRADLLPSGTHCTPHPQGFKHGECAAELTDFLATQDQNPSLSGTQTVDTYTIGLAVDEPVQQYLESLRSPRGRSFQADNSNELTQALQQAITHASKQTPAYDRDTSLAFVSPAYGVNQKGQLAHNDDIYMPLFTNNGSGEWQGNLRKFKRNAQGEIIGKNGRIAVDAQGKLTDDAQGFWSSKPTGNNIRAGGAAEKIIPANRTLLIDADGSKTLSRLSTNNAKIRGGHFIRGYDEAMQGRWKDRCEQAEDNASKKASICHRPPGNPENEHTLQIGLSAVKAHLAHGDHEGSCASERTSSPANLSARLASKTDKSSKKTFICHIPPGNTGNPHTLEVSTSAVSAHLAHGDTLGACTTNTPEPTDCAAGNSRKVPVCHRPPGNVDNAQTLYLPVSAVRAHLAHGDYEGECSAISEQQRHEFIRYAQGYNTHGQARRHMGDILHSKPVIVQYANGRQLILSGTNEGYLHAFDSESGEEHWAFMPHMLLPNVKEHKENAADQHIYGVDGNISLWYTRDAADKQKIYAYFGLRRGGRAYYALDISDPDSPELLWRIDPQTRGFAALGQTWSSPTHARLHTGADRHELRDVLVFGGGYDAAKDEPNSDLREADQYGHDVYIVDAHNGQLLWSAQQGITQAKQQLTHSIPGDIRILDTNEDGALDRLYFADTGGHVWRIDIGDVYNRDTPYNPTKARLTKLADLGGDNANPRMFFYEPDAAIMGHQGKPVITLALGSGYRAHPLDETMQDRFYVLVDEYAYENIPDDFEPLTESKTLTSVKQLGGSSVLSSSYKGWYYDLPHQAEKVLAPALTFANKAIFTTFAKDKHTAQADSCHPLSSSARTYVLNLMTGEAVADLNRDQQGKDVSLISGQNEILDAPQLIFKAPTSSAGKECTMGDCQQTLEIRSGKAGIPVIDATNLSNDNDSETADVFELMEVIYWINSGSFPDQDLEKTAKAQSEKQQ